VIPFLYLLLTKRYHRRYHRDEVRDVPRSRNLTWVRGSAGRRGRWRKKYRGKVHYFDGGRGKSDAEAYAKALSDWETLKTRVDAAAPNPHQAKYDAAINEWDRVLTWSRKHRNEAMCQRADKALVKLRRGLTNRPFRPPANEDLFASHFDLAVRSPALLKSYQELGKTFQSIAAAHSHTGGFQIEATTPRAATTNDVGPHPTVVITPSEEMFDQQDPLRIEHEIWRDRLDVMRRDAQGGDKTVRAQVTTFLGVQRAKANSAQMSLGRLRGLETLLQGFADWLGGDFPVTEISGQTLVDYHAYLLSQVQAKVWATVTASNRLESVKTFIRWLWRTEAIATLPRILDGRCNDLEISKSAPSIIVFTKAEIASLLMRASARTRLYVLLTLNTAMTQKDIADLDLGEVDWQTGRINRKRSKTKHHATVPMVSYSLWPETLALFTQERSSAADGRALVNKWGRPLWEEHSDASGKYSKNDNVRNAFGRLTRKCKISKPFKSLKKTSASELADSKEFRSVRNVFLGHAPTGMADRHYAQAPAELLDEAIEWLRGRLDIEKNCRNAKAK
jgi:integrase